MKKYLISILFALGTLYSLDVFGNEYEDNCRNTAWDELHSKTPSITDHSSLPEKDPDQATALSELYPWRDLDVSSGGELIDSHIQTMTNYINCMKIKNSGDFSETDIQNIIDAEMYIQHLHSEHDLLVALSSMRQSEDIITTKTILGESPLSDKAILDPGNDDALSDNSVVDLEDVLGDRE